MAINIHDCGNDKRTTVFMLLYKISMNIFPSSISRRGGAVNLRIKCVPNISEMLG